MMITTKFKYSYDTFKNSLTYKGNEDAFVKPEKCLAKLAESILKTYVDFNPRVQPSDDILNEYGYFDIHSSYSIMFLFGLYLETKRKTSILDVVNMDLLLPKFPGKENIMIDCAYRILFCVTHKTRFGSDLDEVRDITDYMQFHRIYNDWSPNKEPPYVNSKDTLSYLKIIYETALKNRNCELLLCGIHLAHVLSLFSFIHRYDILTECQVYARRLNIELCGTIQKIEEEVYKKDVSILSLYDDVDLKKLYSYDKKQVNDLYYEYKSNINKIMKGKKKCV